MESMIDIYDRKKLISESYNHFYKDLNKLTEQCTLINKVEINKSKIFMESRKVKFFNEKLDDFNYEAET